LPKMYGDPISLLLCPLMLSLGSNCTEAAMSCRAAGREGEADRAAPEHARRDSTACVRDIFTVGYARKGTLHLWSHFKFSHDIAAVPASEKPLHYDFLMAVLKERDDLTDQIHDLVSTLTTTKARLAESGSLSC
jgi:hypothetical protein